MTKRNALLILLICPILAGCAATPKPAPKLLPPVLEIKEEPAFPYFKLAPTAPPAKPNEITPKSQNPMDEVWRAGFWSYNGKVFSWHSGYYMQRPAPTAAWSQARWEERSFGWAFISGHWY